MNKVNFFGHEVSKLIIGDNPISGHSYIKRYISDQEMIDYHTTENILKTLFTMEKYGYNTMLPLADPFMIRILKEYEMSGGKLKYIFQPYMPMDQEVSMRQMMSLNGTIGIYHQGTTTDYLFETNQTEEIKERIKLYRTMGVPVGLGSHRPPHIEICEREEWDIDFYMACMYNSRRNREGEKSGFLTGKDKIGVLFHENDRPYMLDVLKDITKPIIAFKIFAGGQMFIGKTPEEKKALIKDAYNTIFTSLKPDDFAAVGVFQRDFDQLKENLEIYDEWYSEVNL